MSSTPENPDWQLLPYRPKEFFGLEDPYDEKQLKRAYNRFLKAFKPEKFPAEFQRIRQAYEDLERRLRYGIRDAVDADFGGSLDEGNHFPEPVTFPPGRPVVIPFDQADHSNSTSSSPSWAGARPGHKPTIVDRLDDTPFEDLLAELEQKPSKSAMDYYHLAVLRDTQPNASPDELVRTLLSGLEHYPQDTGLHRLIAAELNGRTNFGPQTLEFLEQLAKAMSSGRFYELTEITWTSLLDVVPFHDWAASLKRCEEAMGMTEPFWGIGFYIRILPQAVWSAESEWIDVALSRFDASTFGGGRDIDEVLTTLEQTRQYVEAHRQLTDPPQVVVQLFDFLKRQSRSTFAAGLYTFRRFHRDIRNSEDRWLADWGRVNKPYRLLASAAYQRVVSDYEGLSNDQLFDADLIAVETRLLKEVIVHGLRSNKPPLLARFVTFMICGAVVASLLLVITIITVAAGCVLVISFLIAFTITGDIKLQDLLTGMPSGLQPTLPNTKPSLSLFQVLGALSVMGGGLYLCFQGLIFVMSSLKRVIRFWCNLMGTAPEVDLDLSAIYRGASSTSLRFLARENRKPLLAVLQKLGLSLPWIQWHFNRFANSLSTRQRIIVDDWSADPGAQVVYTARRWWPHLNGPKHNADDDAGTSNSPDEA